MDNNINDNFIENFILVVEKLKLYNRNRMIPLKTKEKRAIKRAINSYLVDDFESFCKELDRVGIRYDFYLAPNETYYPVIEGANLYEYMQNHKNIDYVPPLKYNRVPKGWLKMNPKERKIALNKQDSEKFKQKIKEYREKIEKEIKSFETMEM